MRQAANSNPAYGRALTANFDRSSQGLHQGLNGLDITSVRESELGLSVSNQGPAQMDPESSMAIGQDSGLIISLKENGFDFFVNYSELIIDQKSDFIGRGGYGDVYKAKWMGTKVAVKRFGKRYLTKKALKDFIKEIEMLHQLRHPNVVLYMGVSLDH